MWRLRTMNADPILTEVWAVRDRLAARFDYDLDAIFRHVKAEETRSGLRYEECSSRRSVRTTDSAVSDARDGTSSES